MSSPMSLFPLSSSLMLALILLFLMLLCFSDRAAESATFTFTNNCGNTIWPGILSNSGSPALEPTGFSLPPGTSRSLPAPTGWSGRFWARTACSPDPSGRFLCATADCGSGTLECDGAAASPPATLVEFTLSSSGGNDFYDVSLVDGYNLPVAVATVHGEGDCESTGCEVDLNQMCPMELRVGEGEACRSACEAFGRPEYCCSGEFATPAACRPSPYSEMFKSACPSAYSYAFDDASSTFTCAGADYSITFCPEAASSLKSTLEQPSPPGNGDGIVVEEDSWFAKLAMGDAAPTSSTGRDAAIFLATAVVSAIFCSLKGL
ncbi:Thaumatin-like protein 1 [Platanthera zijinensis]|uniref:Thaumatin-like protein 1 n=1 Tax=Platanthera zijinensis TaxID=2320716 RepID=A0AAP0AUC1_9ASPA